MLNPFLGGYATPGCFRVFFIFIWMFLYTYVHIYLVYCWVTDVF